MHLDKAQLALLLKGASVLSTGGGLCYADQKTSLAKHTSLDIELKPLDSFAADDILVTAAEVGPADAPEIAKQGILPQMAETWRRITGRPIAGVYPFEIGQEMITIETAAALNVPLADFDTSGARAVPFVDICSFGALGMDYSMTPLIVATDRGDIIAVQEKLTPAKVEEKLRAMTELSKNKIIFFIGTPVRAGDIQGKGISNNAYTRALSLGKVASLTDIESTVKPFLKLQGSVVDKKKIDHAGFNCFEAVFKTHDGKTYILSVLNEILFILDKNRQPLVAPPDRILLVDERDLSGMPSSAALTGAPVTLLAAKADSLWDSDGGRELFGPARFQFLLKTA